MKSSGLARRVAAFGATTAVLAALVTGLAAAPAQAATTAKAGTLSAAAKAKPLAVSVSTPKASIRNYEGACPVNVKFSAKIKVKLKGKTTVAWRWLHGDGSKGKVQTKKVAGNGVKTINVSQAVKFKDDVKGWEAIEVLGPKHVKSKKVHFSVSCQDDNKGDDGLHEADYDKVSARAWASPSTYVGPCTPGDKIDFTGVIKVDRPRWVHYRWILNGDVVDGGKVKVWDARKVGFGFSPRDSHRGWAVLETLGRGSTESNRAHYKVWCKDDGGHNETKVSVSTPTTGTNHNTCAVGANATIHATGRGRVEYVWSVNGKAVASGDTFFGGAGSKTVELSEQALSGDAVKGGTVTLSISGPNNRDSASQSYAACQKPEPGATSVKVSVSAVHDQSTCKDGKGSTINATATVTVNGAAKNVVVNLWSEVGGFGKNVTLDFDKAGSQTVSFSLPAAGTNGIHAKASLAGVGSDSSVATYGDHCPAPAAAEQSEKASA
ncbi:hypothetical protein ACFXJ8_05700 [Nonomuraea sp. NPDC059194]|uniref:hypothetical protein n=1 Tax=Nonomuraea sp. NPDC059194 TaxID=3346764 RepID=UPI0036B0BD1F